jgi:hypothetical protein
LHAFVRSWTPTAMNMEGHDTGPGKPGREDLAPETN